MEWNHIFLNNCRRAKLQMTTFGPWSWLGTRMQENVRSIYYLSYMPIEIAVALEGEKRKGGDWKFFFFFVNVIW